MAKRFTDSRKYQDPWFRKLEPKFKLFWDYILCSCNHAGIWKKDFEMASFCIGLNISEKETKEAFNGRIEFIDDDTWFISKFVDFQYGELNPDNRAHASVLSILKKEGAYKGLIRGLQGRKDKDMDKDKDNTLSIENEFNSLWSIYPIKEGRKEAFKHYCAARNAGRKHAEIEKSVRNYLKKIEAEKIEPKYIKHGSTFFNNWEDYLNYEVKSKPLTQHPMGAR